MTPEQRHSAILELEQAIIFIRNNATVEADSCIMAASRIVRGS